MKGLGRVSKPRIFLGSSGKQQRLLQSLTRVSQRRGRPALDDVLQPGTTTLERLVEITREVDFAAFIFAQDDWTAAGAP